MSFEAKLAACMSDEATPPIIQHNKHHLRRPHGIGQSRSRDRADSMSVRARLVGQAMKRAKKKE